MPGAPTLLVVEDDPDTREALRIFLVEHGYHVVCAEHGRAALDLLESGRRPDLILLDVMMPVMDGFQFRAHQLANKELASIPVAVLSANEGAGRARSLGALGFFVKPIDFDALLRKLALWCHRRAPA